MLLAVVEKQMNEEQTVVAEPFVVAEEELHAHTEPQADWLTKEWQVEQAACSELELVVVYNLLDAEGCLQVFAISMCWQLLLLDQ